MNLIEQEVSQQRWIDIPEAVLEKYLIWRPSPLYRAFNFEKLLGAPVRIYYKNEGVSPAGSHKPNTAVPQAYYNKIFGIKRLATETGPANGEAHWPWHAKYLTLNAGFSWLGSATNRNLIGV